MSSPVGPTIQARVSRRQLLRGLGVVSAGALLAACSPGTAPAAPSTAANEPAEAVPSQPTAAPAAQEPVSIRINSKSGGNYSTHFDTQGKLFMDAHPDIKVTFEYTAAADYDQKLTTLIAGGELGDAYWSAPFGSYYPLAARGIAADLNPFIEADKYDMSVFFAGAVKQLQWDNKQTGMPMGAHPGWTTQFTNVDAWNAANAPLPLWEWTYEKDWLPAVKAATTTRDDKPVYGFQFDYSAQGIYTFLRCWGGNWIDEETGTKSFLDDDKSIAAMMFMWDLVYTHKVSPARDAIVDNMFGNELSNAFTTNLAALASIDKSVNNKFKWQAYPMPAGPGGRGSFIGIDTLSANAGSKQLNATWEWLKWMVSKDATLAQMDNDFTPSVRYDAWKDPKLADDVNRQAGFKWMDIATPCTFPKNARVTEFVTAFNQGITAFFMETSDPQSKLNDLHKAIQDVLDKPLL